MNGPVTITRRLGRFTDAYRYDGTNAEAIVAWADGHAYIAEGELYIVTNRGDVAAEPGDTVIHGLTGSYYPCPPGDFNAGWQIHGEPD